MLNENDYELLKSSFVDSQRLFDKLNNVAVQASDLDYDESGQYLEDEEMLERHWLKLSSKIIDTLSDSLDGYSLELLNNESLQRQKLTINLVKDQEHSKIDVDYSEAGALSISQIS